MLIQRLHLIAIFLLLCSFNNYLFSEGTKQINPSPLKNVELWLTKAAPSGLVSPFGTSFADSSHTIHVAIKQPGEKFYMGLNFPWWPGSPGNYIICRILKDCVTVWGDETILPISGEPGFINSHNEAITGPNVLDPAGYYPLVFDPQEPGDYILEFDFTSNFDLGAGFFDFTVIDTTILPFEPINGRVWSRGWCFKTPANIGSGVSGMLFIRTADHLVDSIVFNEMIGSPQFEMNFNGNGCFPPPASFISSRRSVTPHSNYPEHQIFFNDPDTSLFPTGTMGEILTDSSSLIPDCNGQYYIMFQTNKSGLVQVQLQIDPLPGIQPEDVIILDSVNQGTDTILWNGLNGLGIPVSIMNNVTVIISFINGLTNFPIFNSLDNHNGFQIGLKRPSSVQPMIFWNDTLIPGGQINLDGCSSTLTTGCHEWFGNYPPPSGFGWNRTINTWWYSAISDTIFNASLTLEVSTPDSIQGSDTICYDTTISHSYSIFPDPLSGAQDYEWKLYRGITLIQTWNTPIPSLSNVIFSDTGSFSLITRGYNNCGYGLPDTLYIHVFPPDTLNLTIIASTTEICEGVQVAFTASSTNQGSSPAFQWKVNGINQGPNDSIFTYFPVNGDIITCELSTSIATCITNNPATSNAIVMTVHPNLPVGISITASVNSVCEGESVTFTSNTINKGQTPVFQWLVNGTPGGINDSVYTYIPIAGDQIHCILTSSEQCTTNNPAISDTIAMMVNPLLPVGITINPSANPVCGGIPVTFTGAAVNGGSTPVYQWQVNGINVGTNNPVYTYLPITNDTIICILTSSEQCTTGNPASSNPVIMSVGEQPDVSFSVCFDTITTLNAQPYKLKGGTPLGGVYSGPGVDQIAGYFNPSMAGVGIHQIGYQYTNFASCSDIKTRAILVFPSTPMACGSPLIDTRDNQTYPTVQIGTQCWMASNLNYGVEIPFTTPQRDNCMPEKYSRPSSLVPPPSFYQWDELMSYSDVAEAQGLCPPGWHVPSEADWNQLFAYYQGSAFAGSPLIYSGYSGFNAQLTGIVTFNLSRHFDGFATIFWSSTSHGPWKACTHGMNEYNYSVSYYPSYRANAFGVRCLRD